LSLQASGIAAWSARAPIESTQRSCIDHALVHIAAPHDTIYRCVDHDLVTNVCWRNRS